MSNQIGIRGQFLKRILRRASFRAASVRKLQWLAHEAAFASLGGRLAVGDIVGARVVFYQGKRCIVRLSEGVLAYLEHKFVPSPNGNSEWTDALPNCGAFEVFVRSINPATKQIVVTAHKFSQQDRFNLFNSGYRHFYDGLSSPLARLPWEKFK